MARPNARCQHCGNAVLRAFTAAGKRQLLNPEPDPAGNVAAHQDGTGAWRARVPNAERPLDGWEHIYMPHPATCEKWPKARTRVLPAPTLSAVGERPDNVVFLSQYRRRARRPQ
jgi:hypothetical protein